MKWFLLIVLAVVALFAIIYWVCQSLVAIVLAVVALFAIIYWVYQSLVVIPPNLVGILFCFGSPNENRVYKRRKWPYFVPYIPIKINGWLPWQMILFPMKQFKLSYELLGEHKVWSKDHQMLFPEFTVYLQFPYLHGPSLVNMVERGVPYWDEGELEDWLEDVIVPIFRKALAGTTYEEAISSDHVDSINTEVNRQLSDPKGVLRVSGIYGENPTVTDEGTGYARLELEQVLITEELQQRMQKVATAKLDVEIARLSAEAKAQFVAAVDKAMSAWVSLNMEGGESEATARKRLMNDGRPSSYDKQRSIYMAQILEGQKIFVGNPDGTPLSGDLGAATAFAAAMAGIFGRRPPPPRQGQGGNQP